MATVFMTPQDKARIQYLVSYWNTVHMDSLNPDDYNMYAVETVMPLTSTGKIHTHQIHTVNLSSTKSNVGPVNFDINDSMKLELESITNQAPGGIKPVSMPAASKPKHSTPIVVDLRMIPDRLGAGTGTKTFAFKCNTCEDNRFWCEHVVTKFGLLRDHQAWIREVDHAVDIHLAVPLFSFLYHRVTLKKVSLADWEGKQTKKLLVDPNVDLLSESFKELNDKDVIARLGVEFVDLLDTREGHDVRDIVDAFAYGNKPLSCFADNHGYGKVKQLRDWFGQTRYTTHELEAKLRALTWTSLVYHCCYFCWLDGEMSLVIPS